MIPRRGWIRSERRGAWEQYVGRRIRRIDKDGEKIYIAWAGNRWAGAFKLLGEAQEAAEAIQG